MSGPWEAYARQESADVGPWAAYASQADAMAPAGQAPSRGVLGALGDLAAGAVRGAGSIGATLLAPVDMASDALAGQGMSLQSNRERRAAMDSALGSLGADTDSWAYKGGKLAGEIAGTAGAGGAIANVAGRGLGAVAPTLLPKAQPLLSAIQSGGMTAPGAGLLTRAGGGAITGAATAAMVNPEDALMGAAAGGAMPVAARGLGMAGRSMGGALRGGPISPEVRQLAGRAADLGIDLPADRIANSKPLNALASTLNYTPFSGRAATESRMQNQLNRAVSRTFGQDSDNVTMALRQAKNDLGAKFDDVLRNNSVRVDDQFLGDLTSQVARATSELETGQAKIIANQVDEIMAKVGRDGALDGQAAYNIKKTLDRIGNQNSPVAWYANDLKKSLMGALNRSIGPDEAAKFATTRKQYGTMMDLQKLAQNGAEGDISIGRLANLRNIGNRDLQELADISSQFLKSRESPHGAMQRLVLGGLGASVGGVGALPYLGAAAVGGRAANGLLNSPAARGLLLDGVQPGPAMGLLQAGAYRAAPVLSAQ